MSRFSLVVTVCVCSLHGVVLQGQTVLYVDDGAAPGGDGLSWASAHKYLQEALAVARNDDEIRVAEGTYRPDENNGNPNGTSDREATFQLIDDVALMGGYAGFGAPDPDKRDLVAYQTVLTGDLNGDDDPNPDGEPWADPTRDDNAYHVVTGSFTDETAVLDGFTVTAGHANGPFPDSAGGGMHNHSGNPTVVNCTFAENAAPGHPFVVGYGGGMFNWDSSPTLVRCTFRDNLAMGGLPEGFGGGMYNNGGNPTLSRCRFSGNYANVGGGMANQSSDAVLSNCTFVDNWSGMYNEQCNPTVTNCIFTRNGEFAGGVTGGGTFTNCILWGNELFQISGDLAVVTYSCVQDGWPGEGNIDADPLFADPDGPDGVPGTEDDNLRLSPGSPCINTGDPEFMPEPNETDLDGHARLLCSIVDMGAYEFGIGDFDCDQVVSLLDFAAWTTCMTDPEQGPYAEGCEAFDFEYDGDVDLTDFAEFQLVFTP